MRAKHVILLAPLVAAVLSAGASPAAAQGWPTRPVTMVVPFAAGGAPTCSAASSRRGCPRSWASR